MRLEMPIWETQRLYLRPIEIEDAADLFQIYGDEKVVKGSISIAPFRSIDDMVNSIKTHFLAYRQRGVPQSMVMECKENGRVIGLIDYHSIKNDTIGELGYMLNHAYWNQGYMKEAISGMVQIGFQKLNFHRIEAMVDTNNVASQKVLEANHFQKEGILRKYMKLNDGCYHDFVMYSILKDDDQEE